MDQERDKIGGKMIKKITICNYCPCLNCDIEDGNTCNLEYPIHLVRVKKQLNYISHKCKLVEVKFGNDTYVPEIMEIEEEDINE